MKVGRRKVLMLEIRNDGKRTWTLSRRVVSPEVRRCGKSGGAGAVVDGVVYEAESLPGYPSPGVYKLPERVDKTPEPPEPQAPVDDGRDLGGYPTREMLDWHDAASREVVAYYRERGELGGRMKPAAVMIVAEYLRPDKDAELRAFMAEWRKDPDSASREHMHVACGYVPPEQLAREREEQAAADYWERVEKFAAEKFLFENGLHPQQEGYESSNGGFYDELWYLTPPEWRAIAREGGEWPPEAVACEGWKYAEERTR